MNLLIECFFFLFSDLLSIRFERSGIEMVVKDDQDRIWISEVKVEQMIPTAAAAATPQVEPQQQTVEFPASPTEVDSGAGKNDDTTDAVPVDDDVLQFLAE